MSSIKVQLITRKDRIIKKKSALLTRLQRFDKWLGEIDEKLKDMEERGYFPKGYKDARDNLETINDWKILLNKVRLSESSYRWRLKIYEKDNYTCTKCGNKGRRKKDPMADVKLPILMAIRKIPLEDELRKINVLESRHAHLAETFPKLWRDDNADTVCQHCFYESMRAKQVEGSLTHVERF